MRGSKAAAATAAAFGVAALGTEEGAEGAGGGVDAATVEFLVAGDGVDDAGGDFEFVIALPEGDGFAGDDFVFAGCGAFEFCVAEGAAVLG